MLSASISSRGPGSSRPSSTIRTGSGAASASARRNASRPRRSFSPASASPASAMARASAPRPTPSTKRRRPHGPAATPMSRGRGRAVRQPAARSCKSPGARPSERATLFAVPSGRMATGTDRSGTAVTTSATVPSPPATTTRSAGSRNASARSAPLVERYEGARPAPRRAARISSALGRPSPAEGLCSRTVHIITARETLRRDGRFRPGDGAGFQLLLARPVSRSAAPRRARRQSREAAGPGSAHRPRQDEIGRRGTQNPFRRRAFSGQQRHVTAGRSGGRHSRRNARAEGAVSTTGLEVFDKTLQTTHTWLDEITAGLGPDRQRAYRVLRAVLHALRDRLPLELAAHLGAQLPLLVRGIYYDEWRPRPETSRERSQAEFLQHVAAGLRGVRPTDTGDATRAVFGVIARHVTEGQVEKVRQALPEDGRRLWPQAVAGPQETAPREEPAGG